MSNRTPEAEGLDVVVVGSFNPAIFHPEWFFRQNLISEQDAKDSSIKVISGEVTDLQLCGLKLVCIHERLVLGTSNVSRAALIQDLLMQMFNFLPHTPITACGINTWVHYPVSSTAYWNRIGHVLAPKDLIWKELFKDPGMLSLVIQERREGEFPGQINIAVEPLTKLPPKIIVRSNYHYGLPPDSVHAGSTELLLKFLRAEWNSACEMPRRVANVIFDKVKPDDE